MNEVKDIILKVIRNLTIGEDTQTEERYVKRNKVRKFVCDKNKGKALIVDWNSFSDSLDKLVSEGKIEVKQDHEGEKVRLKEELSTKVSNDGQLANIEPVIAASHTNLTSKSKIIEVSYAVIKHLTKNARQKQKNIEKNMKCSIFMQNETGHNEESSQKSSLKIIAEETKHLKAATQVIKKLNEVFLRESVDETEGQSATQPQSKEELRKQRKIENKLNKKKKREMLRQQQGNQSTEENQSRKRPKHDDADCGVDSNGLNDLKDEIIQCIKCGNNFTFTKGEKRYFQSKGLHQKRKICKMCKADAKQENSQ